MSNRKTIAIGIAGWLACLAPLGFVVAFDRDHSRSAIAAEHADATPASATLASVENGAPLHRLAVLCSRERPSIGYGPRTCDYPSGRFYRALADEYDQSFPEDQAGALMRAWSIVNVADRRAAVRRALNGHGYRVAVATLS